MFEQGEGVEKREVFEQGGGEKREVRCLSRGREGVEKREVR